MMLTSTMMHHTSTTDTMHFTPCMPVELVEVSCPAVLSVSVEIPGPVEPVEVSSPGPVAC